MINSPCELLLKDLSAGQLDISFVLQPECMDENLHTELLLEEKMCLVAPAGHTQPDFLPNLEKWYSIQKRNAATGLGVSYLPYYTVKTGSESGLLRTKLIETDPAFFTQIVYHKKEWISPAIKALLTLSREYGRKWSD